MSSQGAISHLAINGQEYEFITCTGGAVHELTDNSDRAIRGIMDRVKERVSQGLITVAIKVVMQPSPAELNLLLPLFGTTETVDVFALDQTLPSFPVIMDHVAKVHTYATCKFDKIIVRGQRGGIPIQLELHIIGTSVTEGAAGSFSATAIDTDIAYAFHAGILTLEGGSRNFDRFAFIWDNHIYTEFNNSRTVTDIDMAYRTFDLACSTPYTSNESTLLTTPVGSSAGTVGTLVYTRAGQSTTFSLANLKSIARDPDINGKTEIRLPLFYRAYKSGATEALVVTHDPVA